MVVCLCVEREDLPLGPSLRTRYLVCRMQGVVLNKVFQSYLMVPNSAWCGPQVVLVVADE